MSDFGKKLLTFGIVAALMFCVLAAITWFKVNQYDEGEFTMNTLQGIASAVVLVFMAQLKNVFGVVVLTASLLTASVADAGLFNLFTRARSSSSACANGQCGIKAVKPLPLPAASGTTKPVKPLAPKPPLTNEQKREAFNKAVREGRYGEILVGNDFTPGGSDFDGPVDYIPVAPKPTPSK